MKPLKDFHSIPVRIRVIDKIGVDQKDKAGYRKRAYSELKILYSQMYHNNLQQSGRTVSIADNVSVHCYINHGIKNAVVTIGVHGKKEVKIEACWCCGPCIVAGVILEISGVTDDTTLPYADDTKYYASIRICQKSDETTKTQRIKVTETLTSGASKAPDVVTYTQNNSFNTSQIIQNVPISDRFRHTVGSTVLVLISPLYSLETDAGMYNPCINKRALTNQPDHPLQITLDLLASTGFACKINRDKKIWEDNPRLLPYRILPIIIPSCLTGAIEV